MRGDWGGVGGVVRTLKVLGLAIDLEKVIRMSWGG